MTPEEKKAKNRESSRRWRAANPAKKLASHYAWVARNPETAYESRAAAAVKTIHGLSRDEFNAMLAAQLGRCDICQVPMYEPHVDHDHATGKIRGLLCRTCNTGLGWAEKAGYMRNALAYLARHVPG